MSDDINNSKNNLANKGSETEVYTKTGSGEYPYTYKFKKGSETGPEIESPDEKDEQNTSHEDLDTSSSLNTFDLTDYSEDESMAKKTPNRWTEEPRHFFVRYFIDPIVNAFKQITNLFNRQSETVSPDLNNGLNTNNELKNKVLSSNETILIDSLLELNHSLESNKSERKPPDPELFKSVNEHLSDTELKLILSQSNNENLRASSTVKSIIEKKTSGQGNKSDVNGIGGVY